MMRVMVIGVYVCVYTRQIYCTLSIQPSGNGYCEKNKQITSGEYAGVLCATVFFLIVF